MKKLSDLLKKRTIDLREVVYFQGDGTAHVEPETAKTAKPIRHKDLLKKRKQRTR